MFSRTLRSCANYLRSASEADFAGDLETTRRDLIKDELTLSMHMEAYEREPGADQAVLAELKRGLIGVRLITGSITYLTPDQSELGRSDLGATAPSDTRSVVESVTVALDEASGAFARNETPVELPRLIKSGIARPLSPKQAELRDIGVCAQSLMGMVPLRGPSNG